MKNRGKIKKPKQYSSAPRANFDFQRGSRNGKVRISCMLLEVNDVVICGSYINEPLDAVERKGEPVDVAVLGGFGGDDGDGFDQSSRKGYNDLNMRFFSYDYTGNKRLRQYFDL